MDDDFFDDDFDAEDAAVIGGFFGMVEEEEEEEEEKKRKKKRRGGGSLRRKCWRLMSWKRSMRRTKNISNGANLPVYKMNALALSPHLLLTPRIIMF